MPNNRVPDGNRGYRHPFVFGLHYLGGVGDAPRTLTDLAMSQFSAEIRRFPEWWKHFKDDETRRKWTESALQRTWNILTPSAEIGTRLSLAQISYVLDELAGYASLRHDELECQVSCFERIWESDSLLSSASIRNLSMALDELRTRNTSSREHHALNYFIDPALYPLVYNKTLVSQRDGKLLPIPSPISSDIYTVSSRFALLPADVSVGATTGSVKFTSYINNLHPGDYGKAYELLETLLGGFIPLFERTLTDLHRNNPLTPRISGGYRYLVWDEPEPPDHSDDEDGWIIYEKEMRQWALNRPINVPDIPATGYKDGIEVRKHQVNLKGRSLQFIVSAYEISLSPENSSYVGTTWHVEGMKNNRIVASGFYCLSTDNISETSIEFRMAVTFPRGFTAGDTGATLRTWGVRDGDSCNQHIGHVPIRPGLALVFPNIYQHKQTAFQLKDTSRDGHLKAIWFYLVDPDIEPLPSTSRVGPQQKYWIHKALDDFLDERLPHEIIDKIMLHVEGVMSLEEALAYKECLLEENRRFTQANNSYHFCIPFDIWNGPEVIH
ncbi:hypothetical protein D9613_004111 [Agrocybe pediades]|uniref:Uncharacterized protein n=1 Tax=Agrocybe pediades TaxID=84607 RepID=A0A8H4QJ29_9AGAR|nr:hypothetical protein D9613_004111 [Agrocybe pediades]